jgi:cytochrome c biogenesis protein CcmG, thiol:disulfide interchange protein DsbE
MGSASRAALRRKARSKAASPSNRWFYVALTVVVLAIAAAAILTTGGDDPAGIAGGDGGRQTSSVTVTGDVLPHFQSAEKDPAVGMTMPSLAGVGFGGESVAIDNKDGRPKILMFVAHWCPHCQAEVPVVQSWIDSGGLTSQVDLYSVSTAVDESMPNYPPSEWLEREGWTAPVLLDDDGSEAGHAAGVSSYPYFVFVKGDGSVAARAAGELSTATLEGAVELLQR